MKLFNTLKKTSSQGGVDLETHVHADHLTASQYLKSRVGGKIAMSEKIQLCRKFLVQSIILILNILIPIKPFDYLFKDHEHFKIGEMDAYNIPTQAIRQPV